MFFFFAFSLQYTTRRLNRGRAEKERGGERAREIASE